MSLFQQEKQLSCREGGRAGEGRTAATGLLASDALSPALASDLSYSIPNPLDLLPGDWSLCRAQFDVTPEELQAAFPDWCQVQGSEACSVPNKENQNIPRVEKEPKKAVLEASGIN